MTGKRAMKTRLAAVIGVSAAVAALSGTIVPRSAFATPTKQAQGALTPFSSPTGIAADAAGNVYVGDSGRTAPSKGREVALVWTRIRRFSSDGRVMASWSYFAGASQNGAIVHLTTDRQGHLWVGDAVKNAVLEFTSAGRLLRQFRRTGASAGVHRALISGIAVDTSGNIYVTDLSLNEVQKYSPMGRLLATWPSRGAAGHGQFRGAFVGPMSIASDGSGALYVGDQTDSGRIVKLSPSGAVLATWNRLRADGQRVFPWGLAVGAANSVYVADPTAHSVIRFASNGQVRSEWKPDVHSRFGPFALAIGRGGQVIALSSFPASVVVLSPSGRVSAVWK